MFDKYLNQLNRLYRSGNATEHSYRPALQDCLTQLLKDVQVTNEPKRQKCGAPDYILSRRKIDIGYIEAKDIGVNLAAVENDEQLTRYRASLDNLILTDYVDFRFFVNGQKVEEIRIAEPTKKGLEPKPENFARLQSLLVDFASFEGQPIKSAKQLAEMMAHKAALLRDVFFKTVMDESETEATLKDQLEAFKAVLVHDMDEAQFADVYAQTIAYGLFTARLHDETPKNFSRGEALTLIPKSNPFLRQLFHYVAGPDLDSRVVWIVDALCEVFRYTDLAAVLKDFGTATGKLDPILHFYETFLAEYDPKLRKARGVYYTPEPVVNYIVRAIDDVLKTHFGLKEGLAHTGMVEIEVDGHAKGKTIKVKQQVHKVQLLDVATGTGTFLAEVVKQIYTRFKNQKGAWSSYVDQHLLPRMHGFELLMAPYAMCHMKLELLLKETNYAPSNPTNPPRLSVYLTNSLEEYHPDTGTLFAQWLSKEANAASRIKKDIPIMVALGNPPYSGISSNMNSWIAKTKIEDYKYVDGVHFGERKHWLNDDYVQFIRLGEYYIEKNGEGILSYITNHAYLDNPTFRGMRWHLLNTFDEIYVLDLHGNTKKKESPPEGIQDQNVFDIQQGVAIIVAIRLKSAQKRRTLAKVYRAELWGSRDFKYQILDESCMKGIDYKLLDVRGPLYLFASQDYDVRSEYADGFAVNELFTENTVGCVTGKDRITIGFSKNEAWDKVSYLVEQSDTSIRQRFGIKDKDARDWTVPTAKKDAAAHYNKKYIVEIRYRPFDDRYTLYTGTSRGLYASPQRRVMEQFFKGDNIGLVVTKINRQASLGYFFCTNKLTDFHILDSAGDATYLLPLYNYVKDILSHTEKKRDNLDAGIFNATKRIVPDVGPQGLFDYIYAVLYSRAYRGRYAQFLKSDFPRIPYPKDKKTFHALAAKGAELRGLHLMESPALDDLITTYPVSGNHEVVAPRWESAKDTPRGGRVWINRAQYFDTVPLAAWEFYIGGYQPAQKWLKDRKGRELSSDDLLHWQRIIVALAETDKVMSEIDKIDFLPD